MTGTTKAAVKVESLEASRRKIWTRIQAGDREVCTALYCWPRRGPKGTRRLPATLHPEAIRAAAEWVKANAERVRGLVRTAEAKTAAAARPTEADLERHRAEVRGCMSFYRREPEVAVVLADGSGEYAA